MAIEAIFVDVPQVENQGSIEGKLEEETLIEMADSIPLINVLDHIKGAFVLASDICIKDSFDSVDGVGQGLEG